MEISKQLRNCQEFFDTEDLFDIAKDLIIDSVWVVRCDAANSFISLKDEDDVRFIKKLAYNKEYYIREEASIIIRLMNIDYVKENEELVMETLKDLANDKVANVRIEAAKATRALLKEINDNEILKELDDKFKKDSDADVVFSINNDIENQNENDDAEIEEEEDGDN